MTSLAPPVKILIVDDLEENLVALEALLKNDDVLLLRARSGSEALELLLIHDLALALVDVQMPEMDGIELVELMRGAARTQHIPIIFVTAGAWERNRLFRGYDVGAVDFLFKPIDAHILRHKVQTFVTLYKQRLEIAEKLGALEKSELEARQLRDELSAMLRLNETFVATVSHDLKSPLNAVLMATELMLARHPGTEERRIVERARSSTRRMANMIDQLFDLSRARLAGGIPISVRDDIDLSKVVEDVTHELAVSNADRPVELRIEGDTIGAWDPDRLSRVASNLLGNAVRHGTPETPIAVVLDGRRVNEVAFTVENSGQISADLLPSLFAPFRDKEPHRARGEGLGLGLFIVSEIVQAHGGHIEVSSKSGLTRFTVKLPRRRATPHALDGSSPS